MKFCVLASGSSGNCIYVASAGARLLIDAGISGRETVRRLEQIGATPARVQAICLTHEHSDHIAGLSVLQGRFKMALYANSGTIEALRRDEKLASLQWHVFATGSPFEIGDLSLEPFSVSHDAYDPVGFVVKTDAARIGIVTDIGVSTHLVREKLKHCQALVVEANHDESLLTEAERPWHLKQRIAGRQGHLSNQHAAELIAASAGPGLTHVFLAHLSADCNDPKLALKIVSAALRKQGHPNVRVTLTYPDRISEVWESRTEA